MTINALGSIIEYLRTDAPLLADLGGRIFGFSLPSAEAAHMPRRAVVVRYVGASVAPHAASSVEKVDVHCYGETHAEADRIRRRVRSTMLALRRHDSELGMLESALHTAGPIHYFDQSTNWPVVVETYAVRTALD